MNRILVDNRQHICPIDRRRLRRLTNNILRLLGRDGQELSIVLTDDEGIREINHLYLGRDYPTNVIAFAQNEGDVPNPHPEILGDVVVSVERAQNDAREAASSVDDELIFLIIHGLLHLLGFDHEGGNAEETARMEEKEAELFRSLKGYRLLEPA
ncbi:MAG: rRNA maturation RNase YbeY [Syntrophales bacterium]|nr:rRNA maturation RNase YbeY [Syntrophales bacterium]